MKTKTISVFNKNIYFLPIIAMAIAYLPQFAFGQTSRSHTVRVTVVKVTVMSVGPAMVGLAIPGGATAVVVAGQDQMTVTDQTTTLLWGTNVSPTKITISSTLSPQQFQLQALALSPPVGTALNVTLSTIAQDFLTGIALSSGTVSVRYTGIALASNGTGTDSHPITFTIVQL